MSKLCTLYILCILLFASCAKKQNTLFKYVDSKHSGITFSNTIIENDSINVIEFQYSYNGGGVGIGDFNNDGLQDMVFTGNQVSSKIYLNKGDLTFEDISEKSNFETNVWVTGVSVVDINNDQLEDIYLSVGGFNCNNNNCNNLLFINKGVNGKGIPQFEESAAAYNLDDGLYAQQTLFFDYDLDGDLDAYIVHNGESTRSKNALIPKKYQPNHIQDVLLRNDVVEGVNHPKFTDVSIDLGITHRGFGLGIALNDFNRDGLPDLYISNDFITDDLLYINQGIDTILKTHNGFKEMSQQWMPHQSFNAMGVDVADINNDALPDVLVLDMLPQDYTRQKSMLGTTNYDKYLLSQRNNYASQYIRNTLQLNNGFIDSQPLKTSEVGYMSGIASTDWSWAPLIADFDNDGNKDIYITNGYVKDITDLDFVSYSNNNSIFGTDETRKASVKKNLQKVSGVKLSNFFYKNTERSYFEDVSDSWISEKKSFSNGAVFADLDNDGDLDIVVNNINDEASIIENQTERVKRANYVRIQLKGGQQNSRAIGAKVTLWEGGRQQQQYQSVVRGYLSSVEPILHFGLESDRIDSLEVSWPNTSVSKLYNVEVNQHLIVDSKLIERLERSDIILPTKIFNVDTTTIALTHQENGGHDYVFQHLLMRQYNRFGPCVTAANVDGEPGDELFFGGSKDAPALILSQDEEGVYKVMQKLESAPENTDAVFVDIDNDNDLDLYIANGGTEFKLGSSIYQDQLYLNDGTGRFTIAADALPKVFETTACIKPNDFDKDGDIDFFVGSRIVKGKYPTAPNSQLLRNNSGRFEALENDQLLRSGMITDALWKDIDGDDWDDLIIVGEWMPITIFKNNRGKLEKMDARWMNESNEDIKVSGWWNSIEAGDFDNDGDIDFIVGNQGLNGFVLPKEGKPVYIYNKDFDNNGSIDPVLAQYFKTKNGYELLPVHTRDDIMKQLVKLKDTYVTYASFSKANFKNLLKITDLEKSTLRADTFASSYIENIGNGTFKVVALPDECQVAPINDMLVKDINNDGFLDVLLVGNDFTAETNYGKYDALMGIYLKGSDQGFKAITSKKSGFYAPGQSHHIIEIRTRNNNNKVLVSQNNDKVMMFSINKN